MILKAYRLAKGKKLNGNGYVLYASSYAAGMALMSETQFRYIVIEEFYSVGDDNRDVVDGIRHDLYCELIKTPQHQMSAPIYPRYSRTQRRLFDYTNAERTPNKISRSGNTLTPCKSTPASVESSVAQMENFPLAGSQSSFHSTISYSPTPERKSRKRDHPFEEIDLNLTPRSDNSAKVHEEGADISPLLVDSGRGIDSNPQEHDNSSIVKHMDISSGRELERGNTDIRPSHARNDSKATLGSKQSKTAGQDTQAATSSPRRLRTSPSYQRSFNLIPRHTLAPIRRPLCIRSLESATGVHASRNKVFDFFAVICSVEAQVVKPPMMPLKRDMRITDPSTDKKVLVSVFVNPINFKPRVGTIALLRSLTTHEWDRGMLNAYPQQCEGKNWFIVNPTSVEGCDVQALRSWWTLKSAETVKQPD